MVNRSTSRDLRVKWLASILFLPTVRETGRQASSEAASQLLLLSQFYQHGEQTRRDVLPSSTMKSPHLSYSSPTIQLVHTLSTCRRIRKRPVLVDAITPMVEGERQRHGRVMEMGLVDRWESRAPNRSGRVPPIIPSWESFSSLGGHLISKSNHAALRETGQEAGDELGAGRKLHGSMDAPMHAVHKPPVVSSIWLCCPAILW